MLFMYPMIVKNTLPQSEEQVDCQTGYPKIPCLDPVKQIVITHNMYTSNLSVVIFFSADKK